jgi:epsilon-lactone hydrolase
MPSPEIEQIVALLRSRPIAGDVSLADMRHGLDAMMSMIPVAGDVTREALTIAGRPAERLRAPGAEPGRVVLYLHGGAYVLGSIQSHRELASRIGRAAGAEVILLDYRLAPEHPFPAGVDDAVAAYRWLLDQGFTMGALPPNPRAKGFAPAKVVIAGDSAGGGLTVATLLTIRSLGLTPPAAGVCLSPWLDLEGTGASLETNAANDPMIHKKGLHLMAGLYAGATDLRDPRVSPIHADLAGLPPLLVQVGTAEALLDDSLRFAERARAAGVDLTLERGEGMIHVWQAFAMAPEAHQAVEQVGKFIRERTGAVS